MRTYFITALILGSAVALAVLTLQHSGFFLGPSRWLNELYLAAEAFPGGGLRHIAWLEASLIILVALTSAWCVIDVPYVSHKLLLLWMHVTVLLGLSPVLALYGVVYEPFSAVVAVLLSGAGGLAYSGSERGSRKRFLLDVLGPRVSRSELATLMRQKEPPQLEASNRMATVLTCRVFNHPELREQMEPSDLLALSNRFLRSTAGFLLEQGAFLDQSSPDCVRVFFGLLGRRDDHARRACEAALELRQRLTNLNDECENRWFHRMEMGIAICTGEMTVGIYGDTEQGYLSATGSEPDLSRRLARVNLRYGSEVVISAQTYRAVEDWAEARPLEMIYDPENNVMAEVYQLLDRKDRFDEGARRARDAFWQGVIYYRAGQFEDALGQFERARELNGDDPPLLCYIARSEACLGRARPDSEAEHRAAPEKHGHARLLNTL